MPTLTAMADGAAHRVDRAGDADADRRSTSSTRDPRAAGDSERSPRSAVRHDAVGAACASAATVDGDHGADASITAAFVDVPPMSTPMPSVRQIRAH